MTRPHALVAFIGKQDPDNSRGEPGPLLSAQARFPHPLGAALLLYAEGGSDRADARDDALADGTQALRAKDTRTKLQAQFSGIEVTLAELRADPSHQEELWTALRQNPAVRTLRRSWLGSVTPHLVTAGGTPAMRELLSTLAVTAYFGEAHSWYMSDRGTVREELPLARQATYLSAATSALRLGEYALAAEQLGTLRHEDAHAALHLLRALVAYKDGDQAQARQLLRVWNAPAALQNWQREAEAALRAFTSPDGALMVLWNEVQEANPRNAVLTYATLLETALHTLRQFHKLPGKEDSCAALVNRLRQGGIDIPAELDAGAGEPQRLYGLRNDAIHAARPVSPADAQAAKRAATDLLRHFPALRPDSGPFLKAPHRNAFAPQRRQELAGHLHDWLTG